MPAIINPPQLSDLLIEQSQTDIFNAALAIAEALNLPVTSWVDGNPTRSLMYIEASLIEALESVAADFIGSGFLDFAKLEWLSIQAKQQFGVDVPPPSFATTDVTLTNAGGGVYGIDPGDLTFKNHVTGATYRNTTGGILSGVTGLTPTITLTVQADAAGSASSALAGEINSLVTTLLGVTVTNPAAAVGTDAPPRASIIQQCRDMAPSLSPNGPAAAYAFVARNQALTGVQTVTRARVYPDSTNGQFPLYVFGANSAPSGPDVAAVQAAITKWAQPLCFGATVIPATAVNVPVTYTLWLYASVGQTVPQIEAVVSAALEAFFTERPIGGDVVPPSATGKLYAAMIQSVIGAAFPDSTFRVAVSSPSGDVALGVGDCAVLGTITATVTLIADPQ